MFRNFRQSAKREFETENIDDFRRAGAHRLEEANPLLELSKLPAYSPELNPVERLFQELRRRLKFRVFESLDEAESYLTQVLKEFLMDKEQVKSLTLYAYIKYAQSNLI